MKKKSTPEGNRPELDEDDDFIKTKRVKGSKSIQQRYGDDDDDDFEGDDYYGAEDDLSTDDDDDLEFLGDSEFDDFDTFDEDDEDEDYY